MMSEVAIFLLALMAVVGSFPIYRTADSTTGTTTGHESPPQSDWNNIKILYNDLVSTGSNGTNDKDNEILKFFDDMGNLEEQMRRRDEELKLEREAREREARENEDVQHSEYRNNSNFGAYLLLGLLSMVFVVVFMFACIKSPAITALICCDMCVSNVYGGRR